VGNVPGRLKFERFYLDNVEVTQEKWNRAVTFAGFEPPVYDHDHSGGSGFSANGIHGDSHTVYTDVLTEIDVQCGHCGRPILKVRQTIWNDGDPIVLFRHRDDRYPHSIGPLECDVSPQVVTSGNGSSRLDRMQPDDRDQLIDEVKDYLFRHGYAVTMPELAKPFLLRDNL